MSSIAILSLQQASSAHRPFSPNLRCSSSVRRVQDALNDHGSLSATTRNAIGHQRTPVLYVLSIALSCLAIVCSSQSPKMSSARLVLFLQVVLLVQPIVNASDLRLLQPSNKIHHDAEKTHRLSSHLRRTDFENRVLVKDTYVSGYRPMSSPPSNDDRQLRPSKSSKKSSKKSTSKSKNKSPDHGSKSKHSESKEGSKTSKSKSSKSSKKSSKSKSSKKSSKKSPSDKMKGAPKSHSRSEKQKGSAKGRSKSQKSGKKGNPPPPTSGTVDVENDHSPDAALTPSTNQIIESSNTTTSSPASISSTGDDFPSQESSSSLSSSNDIHSEGGDNDGTDENGTVETDSPITSQDVLDEDPAALAKSSSSSSLTSFEMIQVEQDIIPITLENAFPNPEFGEASSQKKKAEASDTSPATEEKNGDDRR